MAKEVSIYQIKISLLGTEPEVWRRLEVTSNMSLNSLAFAINMSMGLECYHLHLFEIGNREYGDVEHDDYCEWYNDRNYNVSDAFKKNNTFRYIYDFGDGWQHEIIFEKEIQAIKNERYPKCLDGANACPPEDCGGIGAFAEYKEAIKDSKHPRHQEFLDWNGPYDPTYFDPQITKFKLRKWKIPSNLKLKEF